MLQVLKDIESFVGKSAPLLAGALAPASPLASVALSLIASAFGGSATDPDDVLKRMQSDPEAQLKLKSLQYQHEEALAQTDTQKYQIEVSDRVDARKSANSPDEMQFLRGLAYFVTFGFFVTLGLIFAQFVNLNDSEKQLLALLIGCLVSKWQTIIDFFYGSSRK